MSGENVAITVKHINDGPKGHAGGAGGILVQRSENRALEIAIQSLKRENDQLKECIKDCPIFSDSKFSSYDEFEKWSLKYNYILKDLK